MPHKAVISLLALAHLPCLAGASLTGALDNATEQVVSFDQVVLAVPPGNYIRWMSGKMNVPSKPRVNSQTVGPRQAMYLWPGLDQYGQDCGLFQPVLSYGDRFNEWWISNWFSHCPGVAGGYCHDTQTTVYPGDVIFFYMQHLSGLQYKMGYQSPRGSRSVTFSCHSRLPRAATPLTVETYFALKSNVNRYKGYLPSSDFRVWDFDVQDKDGYSVYSKSCSGQPALFEPYIHLSCSWAQSHSSFDASFHFTASRGCADDPATCGLASAPPRIDCKGNEACESVDGQVPGGLAAAALRSTDRANSTEAASGIALVGDAPVAAAAEESFAAVVV